MTSKKKRVDLDVRPYPSPFFSNYDYVQESKKEKETGIKGPGGGFFENMDKYKSVKEFIDADRKRRKKQKKASLSDTAKDLDVYSDIYLKSIYEDYISLSKTQIEREIRSIRKEILKSLKDTGEVKPEFVVRMKVLDSLRKI